MDKEEIEEAIKRLRNIDCSFFINGNIEVSDYIIDEANNINIVIETVLNLLQEKDNRIEELEKALIDEQMEHTAEIEKKNKIIDKMAENIGQDIKCIRPETIF